MTKARGVWIGLVILTAVFGWWGWWQSRGPSDRDVRAANLVLIDFAECLGALATRIEGIDDAVDRKNAAGVGYPVCVARYLDSIGVATLRHGDGAHQGGHRAMVDAVLALSVEYESQHDEAQTTPAPTALGPYLLRSHAREIFELVRADR